MTLRQEYQSVIAEIADLRWTALSRTELLAVALAYYYFSIQFRENLVETAELYPDDSLLQELVAGECDTDNLSPWPGVAVVGERMNHDEFMRRSLELTPLPPETRRVVEAAGNIYLQRMRAYASKVKASGIATYENGGLEQTFRAMLTAPEWNAPALLAFQHFLNQHIRFDGNPEEGHGALCRSLPIDDRVAELWQEFRDLLICAAPSLAAQVSAAA